MFFKIEKSHFKILGMNKNAVPLIYFLNIFFSKSDSIYSNIVYMSVEGFSQYVYGEKSKNKKFRDSIVSTLIKLKEIGVINFKGDLKDHREFLSFNFIDNINSNFVKIEEYEYKALYDKCNEDAISYDLITLYSFIKSRMYYSSDIDEYSNVSISYGLIKEVLGIKSNSTIKSYIDYLKESKLIDVVRVYEDSPTSRNFKSKNIFKLRKLL